MLSGRAIPLPAIVERGAVIGAGARKRQAERHVHAAMKRVQLERDQSLIVIHAKNGIELAFSRAMKDCVGREWTGKTVGLADRRIVGFQLSDCWAR